MKTVICDDTNCVIKNGVLLEFIGQDLTGEEEIELVIPLGVKEIACRFVCQKIRKVKFPEGLVVIGEVAFMGNPIEEVILPDSVERVGDRAFHECCWKGGAIKEIKLSKNLKYIGVSAFDASEITELEIPEGVETIEEDAFWRSNLKYVKIPQSVKKFSPDAFVVSDKIKKIEMPKRFKTDFEAFRERCKEYEDTRFWSDVEVIYY